MLKNRFITLSLFLLLIITCKELPAQSHSLTITVEGIRQVQGKIQLGLFDNEDDFLEAGSEFKVASVNVDSATVIVIFDSLPGGIYGISLYHDLDSNAEIDKNFIGMPIEPYGISNDAWRIFSAPRWEESSFKMDADSTIVIHLRH